MHSEVHCEVKSWTVNSNGEVLVRVGYGCVMDFPSASRRAVTEKSTSSHFGNCRARLIRFLPLANDRHVSAFETKAISSHTTADEPTMQLSFSIAGILWPMCCYGVCLGYTK